MSIEPVRKEIFVEVSPEKAFEVFSDGSWWPREHSLLASGSPQKKTVMEPRAGGRWYEIGEDGTEADWGKVLAWEPPRRMLLGWQINGNFECDPSATTEVEVNFMPEGKGTRVKLEHRGFERYPDTGEDLRKAVGSENGWGGLLELFAKTVVPTPAKAAERYFVCKLITPRATFMEDRSEAEGEALGGHIGYWKKLTAEKKAVLFGPVGDPAGVWGLGILKVADEAEAQAFAKNDPSIMSGLGFKHEVYPMLQTVLAG